jgi:hypothetical protein
MSLRGDEETCPVVARNGNDAAHCGPNADGAALDLRGMAAFGVLRPSILALGTAAVDPQRCAPGKLAKNRR